MGSAIDCIKHPSTSRKKPLLLNGNTLGQVSRLVDIAAAPGGDLVGQQLGRDSIEYRVHVLMDRRQIDDIVRYGLQVFDRLPSRSGSAAPGGL